MVDLYKYQQYDSGIKIENNVLKGKETPYRSVYTSVGDLILDKLGENEDFVAQVDPVTDEKYTFRQMRERSVRCALWMRAQGLLPGDVVVICSHNQLDTAMPCFGALYLGVIFTPWDAGLNSRDFRYLMNVCRPKMAFVSEGSVTAIAGAAKDAKLDLKIVVLGQVPGFPEFSNAIAEPILNEVEHFRAQKIKKPDETAVIMCSSGTTGPPKGVALSHATILRMVSAFKTSKLVVCMVFSSLHWLTGTFFMLFSVSSRMTNILSPPFEEYSACAHIEKYKVNWIFLAPNMIRRLLKSDALNSPVYGLTEAGGFVSVQFPDSKPGSCGRPIDNVQLKVIDPDTGRVLGTNQRGEFYVKTTTMMNRYYNNPKATAEAVDVEGWLHTGDLGYYDEDGEIFIVDRLKELIKYCNYQISPIEIESVIISYPGVKEAIVVGLPHPVDGEHPIAFIVKSTDQSDIDKQVTEKDLIDLVATELSDVKRLRGGVRFVDSLPKTPSDKVLRKIVRELAKSTVQ